jgi:hypothetical protein
MDGHVQRKGFVAVAVVSVALLGPGNLGSPAFAGDANEPEKAVKADGDEAEAAKGEKGERGEGLEGHREHQEHEEIGTISVDLVLGWGQTPFVVQDAAGSSLTEPQTPTFSRSDRTTANVQSFIFGTGFEVAEHLELGVRVPLTFATWNPNGSPSRSTAGAGNVELEGEYGGPVAKGLRLTGALGVALPTAEGDEIPDNLSAAPAGTIDVTRFDRYSMAKAAAYARGYEDNALFEPQRFGLIPKIGLLYRTHGLSLEPTLKVENLIGTSSVLANGYVGELVGALRVGYWVQKEFELAVRGWFNTGFAGGADDKTTAATVEPQLVLRFGPVRPYAGLLLPLAGPPNQNGFIGVRLGLSAGF